MYQQFRTKCGLFVITAVLITGPLGAASEPGKPQADPVLESGARIEKLAGDLKFTEGPVWFPDGYLLFSDIPDNLIYKHAPSNGLTVYRKPSGNANGHTLDKQGRLISCEHTSRRVTRTEKDGSITVMADRFEGKRLNSPNDVVVRKDGLVFFTDPPYGLSRKEDEELGFYGVYRISPNGMLTLLTREFARPNGLAFSPDEKTLYVADSQENYIKAFDVAADGTLLNGRVFHNMKSPGKDGSADGLKVDTAGNVFATGPEGVWVFDKTGKLITKIIGPEVPANVGFGGADYKTLYMTARTGLYSVRVKTPGIRPGK